MAKVSVLQKSTWTPGAILGVEGTVAQFAYCLSSSAVAVTTQQLTPSQVSN